MARPSMSSGSTMAYFFWVWLWLAVGIHAQTCTPPARNPVLRIAGAHPETCTPGILTVTGHIDMDAHRISNVADPVGDSDAISKTYLDAALLASTQEEKEHRAARMKTVSDLTSFATQAGPNGTGHMIVADNHEDINTRNSTFDGVSNIAEGDRVLVDRTAWGAVDPGSGLYVVTQQGNASAPWILTRAPDADTADKLKGGCSVFVTQGTAFADTGWVVSSDMHVLDVSNLEWMQYAGGGGVSAGTGLTMVGSVISVLPDQVLDTLQLTQQTGGSGVLTFEGPNIDGFDTTLGSVAQTAPRTLQLPDASGVLSTGIPNTLGRVRAKSVLNLLGLVVAGGPAGIGHTLTSVNLESITTARAAEFDGVGLVLGDRVLIYGTKLDALSDVGVYEVTAVGVAFISSWVLTRATDLDETAEYYAGVSVVIQEGTTEEGRGYVVTTTGAIVVDTTEPIWSPRPCELSAKSAQRKGTAECAMQGGDVTYTGVMTAHEHTVFAGAPGIFITKAGPSDTFMKRALIAASESTAIKDVRFQNFGMLACASTVLWSSATLSPHILNDVALIASKATTWGDSSGGVDQFYTFTNSVGMANVAFTVTGTRVALDQVVVMASDTFTVVADNGTTADAWANCGAVATTGCTWGDLTDTAGELNGQVFMAGCDTCAVRGSVADVAILGSSNAEVGVPGSTFNEVGMLATDHCVLGSTNTTAMDRVSIISSANLALHAAQMTDVVFAAAYDSTSLDVDIAGGMVLTRLFVGGVENINWQDSDPLIPTIVIRVAILGMFDPIFSGDHMFIQDSMMAACVSCGYATPVGDEGLGTKIFRRTALLASTSTSLTNNNPTIPVVQHNILVAACQSCTIDAGAAGTNQRAFIGGTNLPNTCGDNSLTTGRICTTTSGTKFGGSVDMQGNTLSGLPAANLFSSTQAISVADYNDFKPRYKITLSQQAVGNGVIIFEGPNIDGFDTTLGSVAQTAAHTINLPDQSGTLALGVSNTLGRVRAKTTASIAAIVTPGGTPGIGRILTRSSNGAISSDSTFFDGVVLVAGDRVLVDGVGMPASATIGVYYVTDVGSGITPWELTRVLDLDEDSEYYAGVHTVIQEGTTQEGLSWAVVTTGLITVDTTVPVWALEPYSTTASGGRIGATASELLGFWGAVPVVQHSEMAVTGNHTSGPPAAVAVDDQSTFDGGLGGSAYNIQAIVAALKNAGFLAP